MMRIFLTAFAGLFLISATAQAASDAKHPKHVDWAFDGVFGTFDEQSVQRGLQVYREVCAACHGVSRIPFRELSRIGFSEDEIKVMAAEYTFIDGPNDEGDMFERPGKPSDKFPAPYPNEKASRAANNGAYPPDLSLIVKARPNGANYVYSLLLGYDEPMPHDSHIQILPGSYYNPYFAGGVIGMPPQLQTDLVSYQDGTEATKEQIARDIVNFLQWAAEPEMEDRKHMGVRVFLFLFLFTGLFYVAMKRVWADVKKK
jgi:ubiquinol-cytochrome c reductase cytochrome c1 subunit